jgi:hypothetical protein
MAWKLRGGIRPGKPLSVLAALVGIGLLIAVGLFFVHPFLGAAAFIVVWVVTLLGIVAFHLWNALGERGTHYARFEVRGEEEDQPAEARLGGQRPELEPRRDDASRSGDGP